MADTSKYELPLGGGINRITTTSRRSGDSFCRMCGDCGTNRQTNQQTGGEHSASTCQSA